jgi:hypothetical protein
MISGLPTNGDLRFATFAIRELRRCDSEKKFRTDVRPHLDFACNLADSENQFASSAMRIEKPLTILMVFCFLFARFNHRRSSSTGRDETVQNDFNKENLANLFLDVHRENGIDITGEDCSDGAETQTIRLTLFVERTRILLQYIFGVLANTDRTH